MLVLTRKSGEGILLGNQIKLVIVEIKGNQVKLGIEAPSHFTIYREEVYRRIQEENVMAARVDRSALSGIEELWKKK